MFHSGPFHYANGLAVDGVARYLYVAQTATDDVVRVPLDGSGGAPEQVCAPGALLPMPDGLAFDAEQNLYVTSFGASALERIRPDGSIEMVAGDERGLTINRATNCAFGGPGDGPPLPRQSGRLAHLGDDDGHPRPAPLRVGESRRASRNKTRSSLVRPRKSRRNADVCSWVGIQGSG